MINEYHNPFYKSSYLIYSQSYLLVNYSYRCLCVLSLLLKETKKVLEGSHDIKTLDRQILDRVAVIMTNPGRNKRWLYLKFVVFSVCLSRVCDSTFRTHKNYFKKCKKNLYFLVIFTCVVESFISKEYTKIQSFYLRIFCVKM